MVFFREDAHEKLLGKGYFESKNWFLKLILGIFFLTTLALFLHFREVNVEVLELNTRAEKYVIAQVDFEFLDVEAMALIQQEEVRDIGSIYLIPEEQIQKRRFAFETFLVQEQSWRDKEQMFSFEEMYKDAEDIEKELLYTRFTDERTIRKIDDLGINSDRFTIFSAKDGSAEYVLPETFWDNIKKIVLLRERGNSETLSFVIDFFKDKKWDINEDLTLQSNLRQQVEESVSQKYTKVEAGKRIIDAGEKVTTRHIAMLNSMKSALARQRNLLAPFTILGSFILSGVLIFILGVYLKVYHSQVFKSLRKMTLLICIIVLTLAIAKSVDYIVVNKATHLVNIVRYPIFVPFAALLICMLVGEGVALFCVGLISLILSLSLAVSYDHFLLINLTTASVIVVFARQIHTRKDVLTVSARSWLVCIPVIFAFNFLNNEAWNETVLLDLLTTFLFTSCSAVICVGLLPLLETAFDVMTDMTLAEYLDPSNELLRRLGLELPGTYQHSLVVANIAEAAAHSIGANGLFCRVGSLYHDVGKLTNPHYFAENQTGGFNIHQLLTPAESAQVIMAHVSDGELLGKRTHLPQAILDVIAQHHGTTLVYYFYRKQLEKMQGDRSKVDEKTYRYPGPKPKSKEIAIIMIADAVEAASRSLTEISEEILQTLVNNMILERTEDGQFDECQLTFEELSIVRRSLVRTLMTAHHLRVKYPVKIPTDLQTTKTLA